MKIPREKFAAFSENFETLLKSKFEVFSHAVHAYLNSPYEEVIHDIRVYSRKLNEPTNILTYLKPEAEISSFSDRNREIRFALSGYRDLEVTRAYLVNETMSCDEEELKYHFRILNHIEEQFGAMKSHVDQAVGSFRIDDAHRDVDNFCRIVRDFQSQTAENFVKLTRNSIRRLITKREKSVAKCLDKSVNSRHHEDLHKLRIEVKKARYILEFLHELGLADFSKQIKRYTKIQQLLGTYCDMLLLINFLSDVACLQSEYSDSHYFIDYCRKLSRRFGRNRDKLMKKALRFNYDELYLIL